MPFCYDHYCIGPVAPSGGDHCFTGTVPRSSDHDCIGIGVRANIHLGGGGGQTEFCPNGFSEGGVVAEIFRDPYSVGGGGGSSINFPGSIFCGVTGFCPLTAVTDPKFVLFKHVLCFARIMSTLCPNSCRQTARIHVDKLPELGGELPPVPYAYVHRYQVVPSSDHCYTETVPPSGNHYCTKSGGGVHGR